MKLVDILARELKVWPEGLEVLSQFRHDGSVVNGKGFDGRVFDRLEIAEDTKPAGVLVTHSQWQAAVDALKAGEQAWDGKGLPPVGCSLEYLSNQGWKKAECIAHKDGYAILWVNVGNFFPMSESDKENFRPARTAEQIAEQEHREAVEALAAATDWILTREACEAVLAAGYRKQVQP